MSNAYGYNSYGGQETETWFDRPVPSPGPSELVIAVKAVGVNPVDHKLRSGAMANPEATPNFPLALGVEASGLVVAVGSDVDGFAEGDAVLGKTAPEHGSYAEHAVLLAEDTTKKPPQLSFVQAAALPVAGGTAWEVLEQLGVTEGETLLINGVGGGVGVMAAQLARNRGVAVFGIGSESKRPLVESLDATLVPYDSGDVVEQMRALLPGGVDAVFDVVGGEPMREVSVLVTDPSRIVSVADPGVAELGGSFLVSGSAGVPTVADMVAEGKVDPKVLQTYPFGEAAQALRAVESGHVLGKIVIDLEQTTQA
ncbi:MAG TPA: NADP-dependent oxidoreductase [Nocardioidaceae bacterium]|jgi:NADPH2:quinone reductase|nr:NADP-dependent oxidoreductase [Actinomycetota bacterium]HEV8055457.1 NADP-dependent oxidoreductase [Nocardioidaceae bacterium]